MYGVGEIGVNRGLESGGLGKVALHAGAECISSVAGGGSCKTGRMSGAVGQLGLHLPDGGHEFNTIKAAMLRGIGSKFSGGKFEDGAVTGAFGYLFNDAMHPDEAERKANARNNQVMKGGGCVAEAANRCAGIQTTNGGSPDAAVDMLKLGVQMTPPGRVGVGVYDAGTIVIDGYYGNDIKAAITTRSMVVSTSIEKGLTRNGLPAPVAGRWGAVAGSAYDQIMKPFEKK